MKKIRVRFAPSPTGPLHIGGVRTALYNYLFARKNKGTFILRIEDTDQKRYVAGAEKYIFETLEWLGIKPDESPLAGGPYGPYRQSERKELYKKFAEKLVAKGFAYYAFDTPDELEKFRKEYEENKKTFKYDSRNRLNLNNSLALEPEKVKHKLENQEPYVIRIKIPENEWIEFDDIIRGHIRIHSSELDDKVIFKSDGLPTYHLANVVDDYFMQISHVIRGEEWIPSTPLHVLLYRYLGWEKDMPQFAHLPLILKPEGKGKLSKRDGEKGGFPVYPLNWKDDETGELYPGYREQGYLPEAVINILAFLGWNPGTEKEIYSLEELIQDFSLEHVGKSGARFDPAKALWYNHQFIQLLPAEKLVSLVDPILHDRWADLDDEQKIKLCDKVKERLNTLNDIVQETDYFFKAPDTYDEKTVRKKWKENTAVIIREVLDELEKETHFNATHLETRIKELISSNQWSFGEVLTPLRLCLVGSGRGIHLFDIMEFLGKDETLSRIKKALATLESK